MGNIYLHFLCNRGIRTPILYKVTWPPKVFTLNRASICSAIWHIAGLGRTQIYTPHYETIHCTMQAWDEHRHTHHTMRPSIAQCRLGMNTDIHTTLWDHPLHNAGLGRTQTYTPHYKTIHCTMQAWDEHRHTHHTMRPSIESVWHWHMLVAMVNLD